jgi:hypothetical protein
MAMRTRMNDEMDARVVVGGAVAGYLGRYPGVAEETYLALQAGKPVTTSATEALALIERGLTAAGL